MNRSRGWYVTLIVLTLAVLVFISLLIGLASAFLIPLCLIAAGCGLLFYWAVRHQGVRNPITPHDLSSADRWADGQPETRTREHDLRRLTLDEVDRLEHEAMVEKQRQYDEERAEEDRHTDPRDFEGPPPINPFP